MDLVVNIADPSLSGLLSLANNQVVPTSARLAQLVRNDGEPLSLRFVTPSASAGRFFDDVDVSSATVRVAIGAPDLLPNAGTFYLQAGLALTSGLLVSGKRYRIATFQTGDDFTNVGAGSNATGTIFVASGTTPTTWTHSSSLQEITADLTWNISSSALETALNNTAAIAAAGNVMVTNPIPGGYAVSWETTGAKTILGSNGDGLSPLSVVSVSRVVTGSATLKELEIVRLIQNPYCYAEPSSPLPAPGYSVTQLQTGTSDVPSIQRLTLAPAPYAGTFSFVIGGLTKSAAYNISAADMQTLVGSGYAVTKSDNFAWDFQWVANGAQTAITAVVTGLSVPIGVTGELNLSTYGLFQAFNATSANSLTLTLEIELQFPDADPQTVLQVPVAIARDVIDLNNLVPPGLPSAASVVETGRTLTVDSVFGDDGKATRQRADLSFATLAAARDAAESGDVILVRPGTYGDTALAKNGVVYFMQPGAILDASTPNEDSSVIFVGVGAGAYGADVRGFGRVEFNNDPASVIYTDDIDYYLQAATFKQLGTGQQAPVIYITDNQAADKTTQITAHEEISTAGTTSDNANDYAIPAEAIWWSAAKMIINSPRIYGPASISFDCATVSDGFVTSEDITGRIQTISASDADAGVGDPGAALWVLAKTIRPHPTLVARTVLSQQSPNKLYITAGKIFGSLFIGPDAGPSYVTIDKWEATANASESANVFADFQSAQKIIIKGDPHADPKAFTGASITASGADVTIVGMTLVGNSGLNGLAISAGTLRLVNCRIDTSANASTSPVTVSGGTLILINSTLIANASAYSIAAASAQNVKVYGTSVTNKAKSSNVTIQVGTLIVDANVY